MSEPFLGEIRLVGFNFAPRGWALANGALLPIAQNTALFSLLGTTFGGNGQVTFGLPDYRGRSPVGMGQGPGLTYIEQGEVAGAETTTLSLVQMPIHAAPVSVTVSVPVVTTANNTSAEPGNTRHLARPTAGGDDVPLYSTDNTTTTLAPFTATGTTGPVGGSQPVPLRNPYLGTNFIIALEGVFPSRQ